MQIDKRKILPLCLAAAMLVAGILAPTALTAQEEASSVRKVEFAGHRFDLPNSLADGLTAFVVQEPTATLTDPDSLQPPRTEFRLQIYTDLVAAAASVGWVNVYTVSDLEGYDAYGQYERLRDLLREQPALADEESLPTLYPSQQSAFPPERYSEFFVNAAYLETAGYRGITFIYGRVIHVNDQSVLFYRLYFEGLSSDDQRYLSAQVEGPQALIESLDEIEDRDAYVAQARALLHEPTDEDIIAWVEQANVMFSSFDYTE